MTHLVTCSNAGEAGILQSLLASAGIDAELRDGRSDIGGVPSAQLFVLPEQHVQAAELIAHHNAAESQKQKAHSHPADGFPFLGIMGFTAIVWSIAAIVLGAVSIDADTWQRLGLWTVSLQLIAIGAMSLLGGMMIGALVALICLVSKVTWRKLRADPRRPENTARDVT